MVEEIKKEFEVVKINPSSLRVIDDQNLMEQDYEVLVQMGIDARETKTYSQWIMGKLSFTILEKKHGDLTKYAKDINENYEVLRQYGTTYKRFIEEDPDFHPDKYQGAIPWGVLQLAANRSDKPQELVNELHDNGKTSFESAYRDIKSKETGKEIPSKPKASFKWNGETGKYEISISEKYFEVIGNWKEFGAKLAVYLEAHK